MDFQGNNKDKEEHAIISKMENAKAVYRNFLRRYNISNYHEAPYMDINLIGYYLVNEIYKPILNETIFNKYILKDILYKINHPLNIHYKLNNITILYLMSLKIYKC